ncbi:MAG: tetratricopeptide repeat protein [Tatlockia sp.]|jgi:YaiO family outer membrane protein
MKRKVVTLLGLLAWISVCAESLLTQPLPSELPVIFDALSPAEFTTLETIKNLRKLGKLQEAEIAATNYLKKYPKDGDVLFLLGLISQQQNKDAKAEKLFLTALNYTPAYTEVRIALIRLKIQQGYIEDAKQLIAEGLKLQPNALPLQKMQTVLLEKEAQLLTTRIPVAFKVPKPSAVTVLTALQTLRKAGKLAQAKKEAQQYLQTTPNEFDVKLQLGLIYAEEKNYPAAKEQLQAVLQHTPGYTDARIALMRIAFIEKNYPQSDRLLAEGLRLNPKEKQLLSLKKALLVFTPQVKPDAERSFLTQLKKRREEGELTLAIKEALLYLQKYPKDYDVTLLLGLIYSQQKNYPEAVSRLQTVLNHLPTYVDARAALIRVYLVQKEYAQASALLTEGFVVSPQNGQLLLLKKELTELVEAERLAKQKALLEKLRQAQWAKIKEAIAAKQYAQAKQWLRQGMAEQPGDADYPLQLANIYLEQHNDYQALFVVSEALRRQPDNVELLIKRGQIDNLVRAHSIAVKLFRKALLLDPDNQTARKALDEINGLSPRYGYGVNEVGISTDNAYVDDLNAVWDYSSLFYMRELDIGRVGGRINYAQRLGFSGQQYELDISPRINRNLYVDFVAATAKVAELFPNTLMGAEAFLNIPNAVEVSAGGKYARIDRTFLRTYTASLNFYPEGWWVNFRPFFFVPKDTKNKSLLYTARVRKYFSSVDHFVGLSAGFGRSPDLADLLSVNFLVIKNRFANLSYTFGLFNYHVIVDLNVGYQRWQYPHFLRHLYDGSLGLRYRF